MTDRELLELAAKAAGLNVCKEDCRTGAVIFIGNGDGDLKPWRPLTDDGDALRLAVKLNLIVECMVGQTAARTFNNTHAGCVDHADTQKYPKRDFNPDPYSATRRAIVRAAAEIGKDME